MPTVIVETEIKAPIEVCFNLARDIDLHCETAKSTKEKAVSGRTKGLIGLGETITFEGVHFGTRQKLTSKIIEFNKPFCFVDEMVDGAFKSLKHIHEFSSVENGTLMKDTLVRVSPLGILGVIADKTFLENYMKKFLEERNSKLKAFAEAKYYKSF